MGSTGIEHRNQATVLQAYNDYDMPNFAIFQGKRLCLKYEGGNLEEGQGELHNHLNVIANAGTTGIYLLKVYPASTKIDAKTPEEGSTTFQLTSFMPGSGPVPNINFQMPNQPPQAQRVAGTEGNTNSRVYDEIKQLRSENKLLNQKLQNKEIEALRTDFNNQIAGIRESAGKSNFWESLFEKHGDKIISGLSDIATGISKNFFKGGENYIKDNAGGAINGTTKNEVNEDQTMDIQLTAEGAMVNPLLGPDDQVKKRSEQSKIIRPILENMDKEGLDDLQMECLGVLEQRITNATLTRMLLVCACLDNDDLNKLLNNLD